MNNGDAGGLWKLLQKRMEHSQGDSWEHNSTWNCSQIRIWPLLQFFGAGPQIINWCKPLIYSALCFPGFEALPTDLNVGILFPPQRKGSGGWPGRPANHQHRPWGWGREGFPETCLCEKTKQPVILPRPMETSVPQEELHRAQDSEQLPRVLQSSTRGSGRMPAEQV